MVNWKGDLKICRLGGGGSLVDEVDRLPWVGSDGRSNVAVGVAASDPESVSTSSSASEDVSMSSSAGVSEDLILIAGGGLIRCVSDKGDRDERAACEASTSSLRRGRLAGRSMLVLGCMGS